MVEDAADRLAIHLLANSGFDPRYAMGFDHITMTNPSVGFGGLEYIDFLKTHPPSEYRMRAMLRANKRLKEEVDTANSEFNKNKRPKILSEEWLDRYATIYLRHKRTQSIGKLRKEIKMDAPTGHPMPPNEICGEIEGRVSDDLSKEIELIYQAVDNGQYNEAIISCKRLTQHHKPHYRLIGHYIQAEISKNRGEDYEDNLRYYIKNCDCSARNSKILLAELLLEKKRLNEAKELIDDIRNTNHCRHYKIKRLKLFAKYEGMLGNKTKEQILLSKIALHTGEYNKLRSYINTIIKTKHKTQEEQMLFDDLMSEFRSLGIKRFVL